MSVVWLNHYPRQTCVIPSFMFRIFRQIHVSICIFFNLDFSFQINQEFFWCHPEARQSSSVYIETTLAPRILAYCRQQKACFEMLSESDASDRVAPGMLSWKSYQVKHFSIVHICFSSKSSKAQKSSWGLKC